MTLTESAMKVRQPTLFIPHGAGPCFFMDWSPADFWVPLAAFLRGVAATLPERPRAIVVVSAHWEEQVFTVGTAAHPPLIYDYYGFPPHTYRLTYPASGEPALAHRIVDLLGQAGIAARADPARGFDHGVFIPLKLMFPAADIPVVQLSLRADRSAAAHLAAGQALDSLRDEGVLIVGSGMSFHNMNVLRNPGSIAGVAAEARDFDDWLTATVTAATPERETGLAAWTSAPGARVAQPLGGEEHLLPLMAAVGAAAGDKGELAFTDPAMSLPIAGFRFGSA